MAVQLILLQTRSVVDEKYRVSNEIASSTDIEKEVFVKSESYYEYDRVASLQDMLELPTTPDPQLGYYRDYKFYKDFNDVSEADLFSQGIKERVQTLTTLYDQAVVNFTGGDSTTFNP